MSLLFCRTHRKAREGIGKPVTGISSCTRSSIYGFKMRGAHIRRGFTAAQPRHAGAIKDKHKKEG